MKYLQLGTTDLKVSAVAAGCMRIAENSAQEVNRFVLEAMNQGINFFDHADIYGGGASEERFAQAVKLGSIKREELVLQSKCGIRKGFFDFSKEHILSSVDGILKRLETEYLDVLLLHRPDTLMEPEEVAEAFDELSRAGKVRHFGVSNQNAAQIRLLEKYTAQKMVADQLQFGCAHTGMIDNGLNVNMLNAASADHDNSILEFCRYKDITIQTWSPLQYGFFEGIFLGNDKYAGLNAVLNRIADEQSVTGGAVAIAWILRHPARMQAVLGTTRPERIVELSKAADVVLSRPEWYEIYRAAGNQLP